MGCTTDFGPDEDADTRTDTTSDSTDAPLDTAVDPDSRPDTTPDTMSDTTTDPGVDVVPECGNGEHEEGEECDDGDANSDTAPNACREDCTLPECGDGVVDDEYGEECDGLDPVACLTECGFDSTSTCLISFCTLGDCLLDAEVCDSGCDDDGDTLVDCDDLDDCSDHPDCLTCPEDTFEENDDITAMRAMTGTTLSATACPADPDFFSVRASAGETLTVDATFSHAEGNIDLAVFDGSSGLWTESATVTDNERVSIVASMTASFPIHVWLETDSGTFPGNTYDLSYTVTPPVTCGDDTYEDNDSRSDATSAGIGATFPFMHICPSDYDYFSFYTASGSTRTIDITFSHAEGDVDMVLEDSTGTQLTSSASVTDNESIAWSFSTGGTYYIRVYLYADTGSIVGNPYTFMVR
jgi:hypothetical protein